MSRSKKAPYKIYSIHTGDGKTINLRPNIGLISNKLEGMFEDTNEITLSYTSEHTIKSIMEYADIYSKFTEKQKKKWNDPITFVEKIGKSNQSACDDKLVVAYEVYRGMPPQEFFELMETSHNLEVTSLVGILVFITAQKLILQSDSNIEEMFKAEVHIDK
jgi:hypothetical protein